MRSYISKLFLICINLFFFSQYSLANTFPKEMTVLLTNQVEEKAYNVANNHPEIHVFIHVCTITCWEEVLLRQLNRIKAAGLYDACTSISLGVLGTGDLKPLIERFPKLTLLFQCPHLTLYERPTLFALRHFCIANPETVVLYLHTKGVTRIKNQNVLDWTLYMEYFAVDCWEDCIFALKDHDVCGVNWHLKPSPHFSGNFWWANAKYVSKLPGSITPHSSEFLDYVAPEMWIGMRAPIVKSFHESNTSHYEEPYPESKYRTN